MANKPLKSIKFPGLADTYTVPEIDSTLTVAGKAADAGAVGGKVSDLNSALNNLLVTDSQIGDAVTLSNIVSSNTVLPMDGGLKKSSVSDSIVTYTCAGREELSPYANKSFENPTSGKYLWGFKYRLTKLDPLLENPEKIRMHMGSSAFDDPVVYDEWVSFAETATVDLTRIRFAVTNFPTAPAADSFKLEIKEMYLYDVTNINDAMVDYIIEEQETNYRDGTVTYGETAEYHPDTSLTINGKAADSKAVGDAIQEAVQEIESEIDTVNSSVDNFKNTLDKVINEKTAELTTERTVSNFTASYGVTRKSLVDGVATFISSSNADANNTIRDSCSLGSKKWLVSFRYRLTKLDAGLTDATKVITILGASTRFEETNVVYNEWVRFTQVVSVDLTRVYFAVAFSVAPLQNQFQIEVCDYYVYDVSELEDDFVSYIINSQNSNYQTGTVTYTLANLNTDKTLSVENEAADGKAVGDAIEVVNERIDSLEDGVNDLLTEVTATLSDLNTRTNYFTNGSLGATGKVGNVVTFKPNSNAPQNLYMTNSCSLGEGKHLVAFKYRITKNDDELSDAANVLIILGASEKHSKIDYAYDTWYSFERITEVDLTRVYFALQGFATVPTSDQIAVEIKDFYIYDIDGVDPELYDYIINSQNSNYQTGTVTYDSVVVAPSIKRSLGKINVKNYGVTGDGVTDDTEAINALFSKYEGSFYFPAGEYMISGTIAMPPRSEMYGDGNDTIINMYNCVNLEGYIFRADDRSYPYIVANDNTKIHDIKLIGNNNLQTQRHYGIGGFDATNITVCDVTVFNINYDPNRKSGDTGAVVSAYGIGFNRCNHVCVERCYVEQCGYECIGFADLCKDCVARDCITKNGWRTCIQVHRGTKNVIIDNCYMIQDHGKYDACFTLHGLADENLVENLRVENCTLIMLSESTSGQQETYCAPFQFMSYCDGLWCVNNKVTGGKRALYASNSVTGLKVIGNQLDCNSNSSYGVKIESINAIVIGNTVQNDAESGNSIHSSAVVFGNIGLS